MLGDILEPLRMVCYRDPETGEYYPTILRKLRRGIQRTVNQAFFDGLTPEAQAEMRKFWIDAIVPAGNWISQRNADDMEKMKKAKPSLKFHVLDDATIATFKAAAETVYPAYPEIGGEGAQAVLDALLGDIASAKKALGIK